jgi:hypothetical protein
VKLVTLDLWGNAYFRSQLRGERRAAQVFVVYYESIKRELKRRLICELFIMNQ